MPERRKITVVSNTGPLLSAFQCNQVELMKRYIENALIPPSTLDEFDKHGFGDQIQELRAQEWVTIAPLTPNEVTQATQLTERIADSPLTSDKVPENHRPEAEAMVLIQRPNLGAARLLVEELAARQIAKEGGIEITGFIGILLLACEEHALTPDEMGDLLETCRQQGTHYSQALIDDVCKLCAELWQ
ncbi:MAG: hypothetical protein ACE5LU_25620 [Anaerolineae bacterium]